MATLIELFEPTKQTWIEMVIRGAKIHAQLRVSLSPNPTRWQWEKEFENQGGRGLSDHVLGTIWYYSQTASYAADKNHQGLDQIVPEIIQWDAVKKLSLEQPVMSKPGREQLEKMSKKRKFSFNLILIRIAFSLFVLSCIFPPWIQTFDRNGELGSHNQHPIGHQFVLYPPSRPDQNPDYGFRLDFGRLFIEWFALGGLAALPLMFSKMNK